MDAPNFLSERERRDRMLAAFYSRLDAHEPFRDALDGLARKVSALLGRDPGCDATGLDSSAERERPPAPVRTELETFALEWALPSDVGVLDLWDSLCDGPHGEGPSVKRRPRRSQSGRTRADAVSFETFVRGLPPASPPASPDGRTADPRRYRLRVGDRPLPGVALTAAELGVMTPESMEPPGWARPGGGDSAGDPGSATPRDGWSDLLSYDPSGIVGDITHRTAVRRRRHRNRSGQAVEDRLTSNEARLRAQGFARPGPRRRPEDVERGARYLFGRVVLHMTYAAIADSEPDTNTRTDEVLVRKTITRWARELRIPLATRTRPRI